MTTQTSHAVNQSGVQARDELRLALVLNGGVSLAVWISGVVSEIDALRCASSTTAGGPQPEANDLTRGIYARLLEALRLNVGVDIIAGSSAGGINGALLATAIQTQRRLTGARDLWLNLGQLSDLVEDPNSRPVPHSVLRGDGKFLPDVATAFAGYLGATAPPPLSDLAREARLIITSTDVAGVSIPSVTDDFGDTVELVDHRLHFRFSCGEVPVPGWCPVGVGTVNALARAARSTASFPFAFAPSRVDESVLPADAQNTLRTRDGTPVFSGDAARTRWMIDGGALDNSPITPVLSEIQRRPAVDAPVHRALVFVIPYTSTAAPQALPPDGPGLGLVAGTTFNLPRDLPALDDIVRLKRYLRQHDDITAAEDSIQSLDHAQLAALANSLLTRYRRERIGELIDTIAVRDGLRPEDPSAAEQGVVPSDVAASATDTLSPLIPPTGTAAVFTADPTGTAAGWSTTADWQWGGEPIKRAGRRVLFRIRAARAALPRDASTDLRDSLRTAQLEVHTALWSVPQAPRETGRPLGDGLADAASYWEDETTKIHAAQAMTGVADALKNARAAVAAAPGSLTAPRAWLLLDRHPYSQDEMWAGRLLAADVAAKTMLGSQISAQIPDVGLRFMRLSAEATPPYDVPLNSPADKLYGLRLGHFGGFIAHAWRANDWMWGRLDGASRLVDLLLDEEHVREAGVTETALKEALGDAPGGATATVVPDAARLEQWRRLARQMLHAAIIEEELPLVRQLFQETGPTSGDLAERFRAYAAAYNGSTVIDQTLKRELRLPAAVPLVARIVRVTNGMIGLPGIVARPLNWFSKSIAKVLISRL